MVSRSEDEGQSRTLAGDLLPTPPVVKYIIYYHLFTFIYLFIYYYLDPEVPASVELPDGVAVVLCEVEQWELSQLQDLGDKLLLTMSSF